MKLSKREQFLIMILCFILLFTVCYQYVFVPQRNTIEDLKKNYSNLEIRNNTLYNSIIQTNKKKKEIVVLKDELQKKTEKFSSELHQDNIILEISNILNKSKFNPNIKFSAIDDFNIDHTSDSKGSNTSKNSANSNKTALFDLKQAYAQVIEEEITNNKSGADGEQITISVNLTGKYSDLMNFIKNIEANKRKIYISDMVMTSTDKGDINMNIDLSVIGIPKITAEAGTAQWNGDKSSHAENPFN